MGELCRVFRCDTSHDVLAATVVARTRIPPGNDVLVISVDKAHGSASDRDASIRLLAGLHPWTAIIDVSGLPINAHWLSSGRRRRLRATMDTRSSVRLLRQQFASATHAARPAAGVDELYFCVPNHPDVHALVRAVPARRRFLLPHGFDSLNHGEVFEYEDIILGRRPTLADRIKRSLLGVDATPMRHVPVDGVLSFNITEAWGLPVEDLSPHLAGGTLVGLYDELPERVRHSLEAMAAEAGPAALLVLLDPDLCESKRSQAPAQEAAAFSQYIWQVAARVSATGLVVKPHPRNSAGAVARITAALTADGSAPVLRLGYGGVPVELAAIPFALSASAALASSASCSLQRLYGTIGYCAPDLVERFVEPTRRRVVEAWLKDNQAVLRTL